MRASCGFTLVEMVLAIVVISVGLAGVLSAFAVAIRASADPMARKQLMAVAESMMEEITLKPFDDPGSGGAIAHGSCDRSAADDIQDYAGYLDRPVCDLEGNPATLLPDFRVDIELANLPYHGIPAADALRIVVTVGDGGSESFRLVAWRTRHAVPP